MIFIDTGAFLAFDLQRDRHHGTALTSWHHLEESQAPLYTSNFVIDEFLTLLGRRASYEFAARRGRALMASNRLTIVRPDEELELKALGLFKKFADQKISFTDCVSFAWMLENRVERVFTFDRHFGFAGFEIWPSGG